MLPASSAQLVIAMSHHLQFLNTEHASGAGCWSSTRPATASNHPHALALQSSAFGVRTKEAEGPYLLRKDVTSSTQRDGIPLSKK